MLPCFEQGRVEKGIVQLKTGSFSGVAAQARNFGIWSERGETPLCPTEVNFVVCGSIRIRTPVVYMSRVEMGNWASSQCSQLEQKVKRLMICGRKTAAV